MYHISLEGSKSGTCCENRYSHGPYRLILPTFGNTNVSQIAKYGTAVRSESPDHVRVGVHEGDLFGPIIIRSDSEVPRCHEEDISRAITRPVDQRGDGGIASRGNVGDWSAVRIGEDDEVGSDAQLGLVAREEPGLHIGDEAQSEGLLRIRVVGPRDERQTG